MHVLKQHGTVVAVITASFILANAGVVSASCIMEARTDVSIRVYSETGQNAFGAKVFEGTMKKGQRQAITCKNDRCRYEYRLSDTESFHDNVGMNCSGNSVKSVP